MKWPIILPALGIAGAALLSAATAPSRLLVWNVTASLPIGLYFIGNAKDIAVGERVAIDPPASMAGLLAARGYLPAGVPLLKEVAALEGDTVCRRRWLITINGKRAGNARNFDSAGRLLPRWRGCRTLAGGEIFLMNRRAADSFDGRYFGPVSARHILGRASPIWTDELGNGDHSWLADPLTSATQTHNQPGDQG